MGVQPSWYSEDTMRIPILQNLSKANEVFASSLVCQKCTCQPVNSIYQFASVKTNIDELVSAEPSKIRLENWSRMTSTPFDPLESAGVLKQRELQCPKCRHTVIARKSYVLMYPSLHFKVMQRSIILLAPGMLSKSSALLVAATSKLIKTHWDPLSL